MLSTTAARASREPTWEWVARLARTAGAFVGAVFLGMLLVSLLPIDLTSPGAVPHNSTDQFITVSLAIAIGLPAAFAIVMAFGWRENRPGWPAAGFIVGCVVLAGVLVSTRFSTDAGVPLPYFPDYAWWACALAPAVGAVVAFFFLRRRARDRSIT